MAVSSLDDAGEPRPQGKPACDWWADGCEARHLGPERHLQASGLPRAVPLRVDAGDRRGTPVVVAAVTLPVQLPAGQDV